MTGVDAHGLLREQITQELFRQSGLTMPNAVRALMPLVEAAIAAAEMKFADEVHAQHREALAAARRDALEQAAEAARGMYDPASPICSEWADWLRARAAELPADVCGKHLRERAQCDQPAGHKGPHQRAQILATPEEPPPAEDWIPCCGHCGCLAGGVIGGLDNAAGEGHDDTCAHGCNDNSGEVTDEQ